MNDVPDLLVPDSRVKAWVGYIRIRDDYTCVACNTKEESWQLQVHHIFPKSIYPEFALILSNGVTLCTGCHLEVVHGGNSIRDIENIHQWAMHVPSFRRYNEFKGVRDFNEVNQPKLLTPFGPSKIKLVYDANPRFIRRVTPAITRKFYLNEKAGHQRQSPDSD